MKKSGEPTIDELKWFLERANKRINELRSPIERIADQLGRAVMDGLTQKIEHGAEIPEDVLLMIAGTLQSHIRISGGKAAREVRGLYDACYEKAGPDLDELEARSLGTMPEKKSKPEIKSVKVRAKTRAESVVRVTQRTRSVPKKPNFFKGNSVTVENDEGDIWVVVRSVPDEDAEAMFTRIAAHYGSKNGPQYFNGVVLAYYFADGVADAIAAASQMFFVLYEGITHVTFNSKKGVVKRLSSGR